MKHVVVLQAEVSKLHEEQAQKAASDARLKQHVSVVKRITDAFNPHRLSMTGWQAQMTEKLQQLDELKRSHPALDKVFQCKDGIS